MTVKVLRHYLSANYLQKSVQQNFAQINKFPIDSVNKPVDSEERRGEMKAEVEKGRRNTRRVLRALKHQVCVTPIEAGSIEATIEGKRNRNESITVAVASIVRVASYTFIGFIYRGSERITHRFFATLQRRIKNVRQIN